MKARSGARLLRLSPAWVPHLQGRALVLLRAADGTELRLTGRGKATLAAAFEALREPFTPRALRDALEPLGADAREKLLSLFREHEVVRVHHPVSPPPLRGRGPLRNAVARSLGGGGWRLPPLFTGGRWTRRSATGTRPGEVALFLVGGGLVASLAQSRPCPFCAVLRRLGQLGQSGEEQTPLILSAGSAEPPPEDLEALVAALLIELEARPLSPGEALVAHPPGGVVRATLLSHPDCDVCAPRLRRTAASARRELLRALARTEQAPIAPGGRQAWIDPHLGPLLLVSESHRRALQRSGIAFMWGSVRLTRWMRGQARSVSTHGGIHASHPDSGYCRLVALSEGVERVAAMSARPALWRTATSGGERRRQAFCHAVDLVTRRARLVPFERVVVGLPPEFHPEAARHEPFYSGTASHTTLAQAVLHATLELLARDAYMITWYRRRALRQLTWPHAPSALAKARGDYLRSQGVRLELFDMNLDGPLPTLLLRASATRGRGNWPRGGTMLAAGIGFDAMQALEQVLKLVYGQYCSLAHLPAPEKDPLDPEAVSRLSAVARAWPLFARYLDPGNSPAHAFLGEGRAPFEELVTSAPGDTAGRLAFLRGWFEERGLPWLVTRLTDEHAARAGFEVARVVVPGLVPAVASREETPFALPRMQYPWPDATCAAPNPEPHPLY